MYNNGQPIMVGLLDTSNSNNGHFVVIYGYTVLTSGTTYKIWDPQNPNSSYTISSSSRTYSLGDTTFKWTGGYITYIRPK